MTSLAFNHTIKVSLLLLLYSVSESQGLGQEEDQFIDPDPQHQLYLADGAFYIKKKYVILNHSRRTLNKLLALLYLFVT